MSPHVAVHTSLAPFGPKDTTTVCVAPGSSVRHAFITWNGPWGSSSEDLSCMLSRKQRSDWMGLLLLREIKIGRGCCCGRARQKSCPIKLVYTYDASTSTKNKPKHKHKYKEGKGTRACACVVPVHTWLMLVLMLMLVLASSRFTGGLCLCLCLCRPGSHVAYACAYSYACAASYV